MGVKKKKKHVDEQNLGRIMERGGCGLDKVEVNSLVKLKGTLTMWQLTSWLLGDFDTSKEQQVSDLMRGVEV